VPPTTSPSLLRAEPGTVFAAAKNGTCPLDQSMQPRVSSGDCMLAARECGRRSERASKVIPNSEIRKHRRSCSSTRNTRPGEDG
jgi:hypothetical protein